MLMRWLQIEKDIGPSVVLFGVLGWSVGIAVFLLSDWLTAIFAGCITAVAPPILVDLIASWRIPAEARLDAEKAVAEFTKLYPERTLDSVALRAIEDDRFVYSIRYDEPNVGSMPQQRCHFAVFRGPDGEIIELDPADWWPRGLK